MEDRKASFEELIPLIKGELVRQAYMEGKVDTGCFTAGQGLGLIKEVLSIKEIIDNFVTGAQAVIKRLGA